MQRYKLQRYPIVDRLEVICASAKNRRVLHVGCADAPYYQSQHLEGRLLHAKLAAVAESLTGVDLDPQGVEFLASLGCANVYCANVEDLGVLEALDRFDLIVAGEIVEHLPNPGRSLSEMHRFLQPDGRIIITVPNAFSIKVMLRVLSSVELVHPDHLYYFSQRTIGRLLQISGFEVSSFQYYVSQPTETFRRFGDRFALGAIRRFAPWLADGLIVEAVAQRASNQ
jgi:2-polyprenyl-3-methyl-5-hydroxy-6-metoxy-1,4-benzoquinol methylase